MWSTVGKCKLVRDYHIVLMDIKNIIYCSYFTSGMVWERSFNAPKINRLQTKETKKMELPRRIEKNRKILHQGKNNLPENGEYIILDFP